MYETKGPWPKRFVGMDKDKNTRINTGMKLSEAIRRGAATGPQLFGVIVDDHNGSCAMGAALIGVGIINQNIPAVQVWYRVSRVMEVFPIMRNLLALKCPLCARVSAPFTWEGNSTRISSPYPIWDMIVHLNNQHKLSRESIAKWVEEIEEWIGLRAEAEVAEAMEALEAVEVVQVKLEVEQECELELALA